MPTETYTFSVVVLATFLLVSVSMDLVLSEDTTNTTTDKPDSSDEEKNPPTPVDISERVRLFEDLSNGYNKRFRPVKDQTQPIYVSVAFDLMYIKEFDAVEGKFSVVAVLMFMWKDELLAWNPANYSGIYDLIVPANDFWRPLLVVTNPFDTVEDIGADWMTTRYYSDGTALFTPGTAMSVTCKVDVTFYPWDTQVCWLAFTPWGFNGGEVILTPMVKKVMKTYYSEGGIWKLDDSTLMTITNEQSSVVVVTFRLKRKPSFVIVNVIIPLVLIAFLNLLVFILPTESGERMSYCVTVLLAIAVFLTLVSENIPKTSEPMSYFCYYMVAMVAANIGICLAVVVNLRIYYISDESSVPACLQSIVRCCRCACGRRRRQRRKRTYVKGDTVNDDDQSSVQRRERKGYFYKNDGFVRDMPYDGIRSDTPSAGRINYRRETEAHADEERPITWADVSKAFDVVFLVGFLVMLVVITATFMSILAKNDNWNTEGWPDED